jgi:5-methylcytosine-specific restriction endonuclease McrA
MIKIDFDEPTNDGWKDWRDKCDAATTAVIAAVKQGETPTISELYKGQRGVYMDLHGPFHGKCAYCESLIAADQPGDVEHFRPKGRVTATNSTTTPITYVEGGITKLHPGYYWLAYDWQNLLPACVDCNSPNTKKIPGKHMGKWNYFPVKGFRAVRPSEEDKEDPLLINPVLRLPEEHLEIDDTGIFVALTEEGQECIDVFCLNEREALVEARKTTYQGVKEKILWIIGALIQGNPKAGTWLSELEGVKAGEKPYSAAARVAIKNEGRALEPLMRLLT